MKLALPLVVPTMRAAVIAALAAPAALLVAALAPGAWIVAPALGGALLLLVVADALAAGRVVSFEFTARPDEEVGAQCWLQVSAGFAGGRRSDVDCAIAFDPRLVPGGRMAFALFERDEDTWQAGASYRPVRRGMGRIGKVWLRWSGPLGLGARHIAGEPGFEVRVWPNIGAVRSPALQTFLRDAQYGLLARRIRGEGTQFEALTEYRPGMDKRRIDWKSSARHVQLYAREFETERNNQIVFAFDCGQTMCEPLGGVPRIDRAVSAALAASYVALRGGDRVALFGFAARPEVMTPFIQGSGEFHRIQRAAAALDYHAQEPNFTLAMATLAGRLARRSLIVIFSDFTDPTSAELMMESVGRLVSRHVVLFVTMTDEELVDLAQAEPAGMDQLAMAVTADQLLRQRALVTRRLRQCGVDVIEAPHEQVGLRLIDAYLAIKRAGLIG